MWKRALRLLEGSEDAELRETVVRAINRIDGHLDNGTALQPILSDPEGIITFERRAVDVMLPAPISLRTDVQHCIAIAVPRFRITAKKLPGMITATTAAAAAITHALAAVDF